MKNNVNSIHESYEAPAVDISKISVESGFAGSLFDLEEGDPW